MPPTMRIPTVEFRSFLLPPVTIPIRAFRTLYRPACASRVPRPVCPAQRLEQRRALNLYKTAKSKTVLGQHKVLNFTSYKWPPLENLQHRVNLWETTKKGTKKSLIADNISLQDLYENHVKPGQMLWCMDMLKKGLAQAYLDAEDKELPEELKNFSLTSPHTFSVPANINNQKGKQIGGLKNIIFNESSPTTYYRLSLDRAYQFINAGCAVEFRLRLQGKTLSKEEKIKPADPRRWEWMHSHFPHLRPDFIMKAMPKNTSYLILPVSDGRMVQWVAAKAAQIDPTVDLTKRLFNIKKSVSHSISEGKQAMLPKQLRKELRESGVDHYSPHTGLPKEQARAKFGRGGKVTYSGEERKNLGKDLEADGFMMPVEQGEGPRIVEVDDAFDREMRQGKHRWEQRGYIGSQKRKEF